jgi:hypothetical protein
MNRVFAALFMAASVLGGCHLIFPYEVEPAPDSSSDAVVDGGSDSRVDGASIDVSKTDSVKPDTNRIDGLKPDTLKSDTQQQDNQLPDVLQPDTLQPDALQPDLLQPDAKPLCAGINCNYGSCDPKTGKCVCSTGFDGTYCNQCAYAYGPYPTCAALSTTVSINLSGTSPYNKLGSTTVDINFINATTFQTQIDCLSGSCVGNPSAKGSLSQPNGNLPTATTNVQAKHTIQWTFGGSGPTDLRLRVFATGPKETKEDNKSIALSP